MASPPAPTADRRSGLIVIAVMAAIMWAAEIADQVSGLDLERYGIRPRDADGLIGIGAAPFLHAGFGHLLGNTVPFLVLGAAIALSGLARVIAVTSIVALVGGAGTWLIAPAGTDTIGASGLIFGYAAYLVARALFSRNLAHLAAAVVVLAVYGGTLLLALVPTPGISWQGHLLGGVGGVVAAWALDRRRPSPSARLDPLLHLR